MPDVYRVRTSMSGITGTPYVSTQFFETLGPISQAGAQESADKVAAFWTALSPEIFTDIVPLIETQVDVLEELGGELIDSFVVTAAITGPIDTAEILPPANQGLVRLLTGQIRNGTRVAGRIFIPGPTEVNNSLGLPIAAYKDLLVSAANGMISTPTNASLAVWHRPVRDAAGVLIRNGEAIVVNAATAGQEWAILRSRRD